MGTAYTKTSPTNFVDGETINASDFTTEFDAIDATFETGGHQHDGTDGEGGAIEKLLSNTITLGTGADTDIAVTFNANTADGVLTWMEDEDYFQFSDDILMTTTEKLQFRDAAIYINSSADGQLDLVADTEIQIAATTVDLNGNLDVSGTIVSGGTLTATTSIGIGSAVLTEAELEMLDGITAGTAAASKAVVLSADKDIATVRNVTSNGTVQFGSLSDGTITATAFVDEDDMASNSATLIPTQQSVKAYVDGSAQTMGDGFVLEDGDGTEVTITENKEVKFVEGGGVDINWTDTDNGTDADPYDLTFTIVAAQTGITSVTNTSLTVGRDADNDIDFATDNNIIFRAAGADQVKIIDGVLAPVSDADIDLGSSSLQFKDAYIHGTLEADAMTLDGTAITATATLSTGISNNNVAKFTTGVADDDFLRVAGTAIEGRSAAEVLSDIAAAPAAGSSNIVTTGALNSGSITSGFGTIDTGSSTITTTGEIAAGSLDISGAIDVDGTANLDAVDIDGAVQIDSTVSVGVDDTGHDVKFFGATSGSYMLWDESADDLILGGGAGMGVGTANSPSNKDTVTPKFVVNGAGVAGSAQVIRNTAPGGGGAQFKLGATRGSDVNSYTIVQSGDGLGTVTFDGADGNEFVTAAMIQAHVDGTPGDNDMPGRLTFATTADGASAPTERMRITNGGNVGIGTSAPGAHKLHVAGDGAITGHASVGVNAVDASRALTVAGASDGTGSSILVCYNSSLAAQFSVRDDGLVSAAGNLAVTGSVSKGSGSFKIDHPLPAKKDTHDLVHSFIEGPQADLIYRGRATLSSGTVDVNVDTAAGMTEGTFVLLCNNVQCFTSNEEGWTALRGSVTGNVLTITAQDNSCTDTVSWMVIGERKDTHMINTEWTDDDGKVIVEPRKET
jgi:hypothetical protein